MLSDTPSGLLFVVSAPSATGKTTVVEQLVRVLPGLRMSRSYTSRASRPGEENGVVAGVVFVPVFREKTHGLLRLQAQGLNKRCGQRAGAMQHLIISVFAGVGAARLFPEPHGGAVFKFTSRGVKRLGHGFG